MNQTTEVLHQNCVSDRNTHASSRMKNLLAWIMMSLLVLWAKPTKPQNTTPQMPKDSVTTEKVETPKKSWAFMLDPTYSPTDKTVVTRISWGWSVHGVDAGGFIDFTGTPDVNSVFGKFTVSKGIKKWVSVGVEYTLNSQSPDKVRSWVICKHKLANGKVVYKLYPVSNKWFEPFILVGVDQKLWEKAFASAFAGTDIKGKGYYGEAEVTHKITQQIDALLQTRVWGTYGAKAKAWAYVGVRVKL